MDLHKLAAPEPGDEERQYYEDVGLGINAVLERNDMEAPEPGMPNRQAFKMLLQGVLELERRANLPPPHVVGPVDYPVVLTPNKATAEALAKVINAFGLYDAEVQEVHNNTLLYRVTLPGQCEPGTQTYMQGLRDCFAVMYRVDHVDYKAEPDAGGRGTL